MILPVVTLATHACASHPTVEPQTLVNAIREDPVAATAEWRGEWIEVTSRVTDKRMADIEGFRAQAQPVVFRETYAGTATLTQVPFLVLEPEGRIHAYVAEIDEAAAVKKGSTVTLVCKVESVTGPPEGPGVVLSDCRVQ